MPLNDRTAARLTSVAPKLIYGSIWVIALLGSLSDPLPSSVRVMVTVFFTLLAVSVANAYALRIHEEMASRKVAPFRQRLRALFKPSWLMLSGVVPIPFFTIASLGWIEPRTALEATMSSLFLLLVVFGYIARRMSGGSITAAVLAGIGLGLLGYAVGQIKLWTKYLPTL